MPNKINLITGETYTLKELFSGCRRIIIPDLQRDYCWGNKEHNLVNGFLNTLKSQFDKRDFTKLSLGLLYGYESPENYVQLCDGQQRITTLFLLLGMLNKWADGNPLRPLLMSDFEYFEDDHEPYLQYSIRDSSLYFLSDLVYYFFAPSLEESEVLTSVKQIYNPENGHSCSWFYGEYVHDPSVMSMLGALSVIEEKYKRCFAGNHLLINEFADYISERLTFIYYDMGNRSNGEETFVVINSTGEPLSATQNLKPLVLNAKINKVIDYKSINIGNKTGLTLPQIWEEMETWFWRNRDKNKYDTSDPGFNEFLRWVALLSFNLNSKDANTEEQFRDILKAGGTYTFPYENIAIDKIVSFFNAFITLYNNHSDYIRRESIMPGHGDTLNATHCFILLPLIKYVNLQPNYESIQIHRLYEFLRNLIRIDNVYKKSPEMVEEAIKIAEYKDITDIIADMEEFSPTILTEEERFKLQLMLNPPEPFTREEIEKSIWEAQNHSVDKSNLFAGVIKPLLMWSSGDMQLKISEFNPDIFKHYLSALKKYLNNENNDKTCRALIAFRYPYYPLNNQSYGWKGNWKTIIANAPKEFKMFLDECQKNDGEGIDKIILRGQDNPMVKYHELLEYCDNKNILNDNISGSNLCQRHHAQPIPIALATILCRLGLKVNSCWQTFERWWVQCHAGHNKIIFTPKDEMLRNEKHISKILVSSITGGEFLKVIRCYEPTDGIELKNESELPISSIGKFISSLSETNYYGHKYYGYRKRVTRKYKHNNKRANKYHIKL